MPDWTREIDGLASADAEARFSGLVALRRVLEAGDVNDESGRAALVKRVLRLAGDPNERPQTAQLGLKLAGRFGGFAAVPVLVARTEPATEEWPLRQEAARALAKFPVPIAHAALIRLIERDGEMIVRQEAAKSLGECGNEDCIAALVAAVRGCPDESVRYAACMSLQKLTGE